MERQLIMQPFFRENLQGKSRLLNEFDTIEWLGKGGFGSVLKVGKVVVFGIWYKVKRCVKEANLSVFENITKFN